MRMFICLAQTGDEVQAGSVLLPASRRGRYLANIVRRQAVMNAEAKKKVDVLSEELLPYIIAEQERRTTLYKRVMTAIQNGEKGVTVAEIRNKPPLIIRKGHKMEGPDLPRNGTTVIGCAPLERTSLNYTTQRCALEDTDDVVVHYRYYPDRFVTELDPDREVCDHWNPCQIGYIYSLPATDQAIPANELWREYNHYVHLQPSSHRPGHSGQRAVA
ncbi:30S ribosomal protein S3, chloroplastic [Operophtera brumata]|uniref:30S ribosomal protein S3, chloroplastic n=1 Tax=Operophtera brumata TaxID=104452 RepID=A0A0L7KKY5_OPEBR|nr:30S ribosomal protein S3, chloroplastic [Operophtera brumata]